MFRLCDINHDGFLTREELQCVVDAIEKMVGCVETEGASVEGEGGGQGAATSQQRVDKVFEMMDLVS